MITQLDFDYWASRAARKFSDNGGKDFYNTWLGTSSVEKPNSVLDQAFLCMFALSESRFRTILTDEQFRAIVSLIQQL
jgi:hypothetical protein